VGKVTDEENGINNDFIRPEEQFVQVGGRKYRRDYRKPGSVVAIPASFGIQALAGWQMDSGPLRFKGLSERFGIPKNVVNVKL
jgi:hypothetical protein